MKKNIYKIFAPVLSLLAVCVLFACSNVFTGDNFSKNTSKKSDCEKATVIISFESDNSRTALPSIDWNDFSYTLTAIQNPGTADQKDSVTLFENRTKEQLVQGVTLDLGKYKFTLTAKKNGVTSLSGSVTKDITGNESIAFRMFAVTGGTGSATVKISFPNDNTVASVKAFYATEIFGSGKYQNLEIKTVMGKKVVVFTKDDCPSGIEQYAHICFYDSVGNLIYTGVEALCIAGNCSSVSEIELTDSDWRTYACSVTLKKDGSGWASSGKTVKLVEKDNSAIQYVLQDISGGVFAASVSDGIYYIYVNNVNTGIEFRSADKTAEVKYWSLKFGTDESPVNGFDMTVVSGGYDITENSAMILDGTNFVYTLSLNEGYEVSDLTVKHNDIPVSDAAVEKNIAITAVKVPQTITVSGAESIQYTITFLDSDGSVIVSSQNETRAYWFEGYSAPSGFTVNAPAVLPSLADIKKNGNTFDVWVDENNKPVKTTEGVYKNLILKATWKEFITVSVSSKSVFANGINLLICAGEGDDEGKTLIFADFDANGIAGINDQQLIVDGNDDFTDYAIYAGNISGEKTPDSDFTFTMTGGRVSEIHGLDSKDSKRKNNSTLNISGTAVIGTAEDIISREENGVIVKRAKTVKGIDLASITNEWVNITAQMTGDYKIYCVTPYQYEEGIERTIAYFKNKVYADFLHFVCYSETDDSELPYKKVDLTTKKVKQMGIERTLVRIAGSGVNLPTAAEVDGDVTIEFGLGDGCVTTDCSVFSIRTTGGSFRVNDRLTITKNMTDEEKTVEKSLTYMVQPTPSTYETSLAFEKHYVYMHILSSGNDLTPEMANDFLKQVMFTRDDPNVQMTIKINLETVPAEDIAAAKVKYFDGSFYKLVQTNPETGAAISNVTWYDSYKWAKKEKFNGMHGYLMTITSDVENNYIFNQYTAKMSWMGASRLTRYDGNRDDPEFTVNPAYSDKIKDNKQYSEGKAYCDTFSWHCGPEAGMEFFKTTFQNSKYQGPQNATASKTAGNIDDGKGGIRYHHWNNKYLYSETANANLSLEPNDSGGEACVQFLSTDATAGYWNDQKAWPTSTAHFCTGFYVEFTPYEYYWDGSDAGSNAQIARDKPITKVATY